MKVKNKTNKKKIMINYIRIVKSQQYFINRHQLCQSNLLTRHFSHSSFILQDVHKENTVKGPVEREVKDIYYYEIPGNKLNPHNYFYRVLAVPYIKFCGIIIITYYTLNGLWEYLDSQYKSD